MQNTSAKFHLRKLLEECDVHVDGKRPWDIQVQNERFYTRVINQTALGAGESYMDGDWDCDALDQLFYRVVRADLENKIKKNKCLLLKLWFLKFINLQTKHRAFEVGQKHYDLGNELFSKMLDTGLNYTCGYWKEATNLEEAQQQKLKLTCEKLDLKPGMKLLDIGCGWGALAEYAAAHYGVAVLGVTISKEQAAYAKKRCQHLPVEIRLVDYRELDETVDRIVSLGMFEHVGHLNYREYMKTVHRCLSDEGLFLLHTIGDNITTVSANEWITKYIFPNGMLPSISQIGKASEGLFVMEDWHNFGADYDKTLMAWHQGFIQHGDELKKKYDTRFYRMWNYYLLSSAGGFRARDMQLWQIVFSKKGKVGGYIAPR